MISHYWHIPSMLLSELHTMPTVGPLKEVFEMYLSESFYRGTPCAWARCFKDLNV